MHTFTLSIPNQWKYKTSKDRLPLQNLCADRNGSLLKLKRTFKLRINELTSFVGNEISQKADIKKLQQKKKRRERTDWSPIKLKTKS